MPSTLIIADDHPLFRAALREALKPILPGATLIDADSFKALQAAVQAHAQIDLVLLDLHMPDVRGFSSLIWLRAEYPALPVAIVSGTEDAAVIRRALDFGASGYIPKSADPATIAGAIRQVLDGAIWSPAQLVQGEVDAEDRELAQKVASLSPQQFRVLMMLADGRLNKQIAYDLEVTEATVKAHVTAVLRKLGLYRRTQAAVLAQRLMRTEGGSLNVADVQGRHPEDEGAEG